MLLKNRTSPGERGLIESKVYRTDPVGAGIKTDGIILDLDWTIAGWVASSFRTGTRSDQHRGQTFEHARVVVQAELSARTKTEEKYISERLHKALEKRVNKIMRG